MSLTKYGLSEEQSDIRAHVTVPGKRIVVFRTREALGIVEAGMYPERTATQPGVNGAITAKGYIVPLKDIPHMALHSTLFPWPNTSDFESMGTGEKGDLAVTAVKAAIRKNKFPLWVCGIVTTDREIDIQGTDIVVCARRRIQVKCDWGCYPKNEGGTGNLFIQTWESNPLKQYGTQEATP